MVDRVMSQFNDWKLMLWDAIDVDFLVEETKKLLKDIKTLHKTIRTYPVYKYSFLLDYPPADCSLFPVHCSCLENLLL